MKRERERERDILISSNLIFHIIHLLITKIILMKIFHFPLEIIESCNKNHI